MPSIVTRYLRTLCLACGLAAVPFAANAQDSKEYLVKAAFIYNFVKFVEWPNDYAIAQHSNIDICVTGDTPLSKTAEVFKAASTPKLHLTLTMEGDWHNAPKHCHILFIGDSEEDKLGDILSALKGQPVLTVSDMGDFARRGGMVGFVTQENKVKIVVNTKAVAAAGLKVDAQLLEIALKVIDK